MDEAEKNKCNYTNMGEDAMEGTAHLFLGRVKMEQPLWKLVWQFATNLNVWLSQSTEVILCLGSV